MRRRPIPGSIRVSRVSLGVPPRFRKDRRDADHSLRDADAPRNVATSFLFSAILLIAIHAEDTGVRARL